jgi:hypothetical protein
MMLSWRLPGMKGKEIEDNEIVVHSIFDNRQDPKERP